MSFVKLLSQAKPGSLLCFPKNCNMRNMSSATCPSPKFSKKGLSLGYAILHSALSYQKNKIAPLNKFLIQPLPPFSLHYDIFGGEL